MITNTDLPNIKICYPPGSGGGWLTRVIEHCTIGPIAWPDQPRNFHQYQSGPGPKHFVSTHDLEPADNVLYIGHNQCRYTFWRLFVIKKICMDLPYTRVSLDHGQARMIFCSEFDDPQQDFFWLINKCRFIQNHSYQGAYDIDWTDLWHDPESVWTTICEFLDHNQVKNLGDLDFFIGAIDKYKKSCKIKHTANFQHRFFQIWCLAYLHNLDIFPPMDCYRKFGSAELVDWLQSHRDLILPYTHNNIFDFE